MKKIYLFLLLLVPVLCPAQHVLKGTTHLPRPGDYLLKQQVSFIATSNTGKDVTWDFRTLDNDGEGYELIYSGNPDSTLTGDEHETTYRYDVLDGSLYLTGYENATTNIVYDRSELIMKLPLSFGVKADDYYYGTGRYCDRLSLSIFGLTSSEVDSYGTLILPGNDTIPDVIRVRTVKEVSTNTTPLTAGLEAGSDTDFDFSKEEVKFWVESDTSRSHFEILRWYVEGFRYPVFETVRTSFMHNGVFIPESEKAFVYHPVEQSILEEDTANLHLQEQLRVTRKQVDSKAILPDLNYRFYPNPVADDLQVDFSFSGEEVIQIFLYDMQGRLLYQGSPRPADGNLSEVVHMGGYPKGNYLLRIQAGDKSVKEIIVKQ